MVELTESVTVVVSLTALWTLYVEFSESVTVAVSDTGLLVTDRLQAACPQAPDPQPVVEAIQSGSR